MIKVDNFIDELEDFLLEEEAKDLALIVTGEEDQDSAAIDSPQKANYFLKVVKSTQDDIDLINALCDEEIKKHTERVNAYRLDQIRPLSNHKEYVSKLLRNYTEHMLLDSKKKSVKLPNGTLAMTKQQPAWDYDDDVIIKFLKELKRDDLYTIEMKEKLNKSDFKKAFKFNDDGEVSIEDGTIVPGVKVTTKEDKFTIK